MTTRLNPTLSVAAILAESATRGADRIAVLTDTERISYGELWLQTRSYAGALRDVGIGYGSPVAMIIPNVPDFPRVYFAVLSLGGIVVPVHPLLRAEEIAHVLRDSGASVLVAFDDYREQAAAASIEADVPLLTVGRPHEPDGLEDRARRVTPIDDYLRMSPLDPATILYTSGTTGTPKGAISSQLSLVEQVHVAILDSFDVVRDDVFCGTLPLFHTFGQSNVMNTAFRLGAAVLLIARFDADSVLAAMAHHGATVFAGVPTMYLALCEAAERGAKLPHLRFAISGGAPLIQTTLERFEGLFGIPVHEGYGLTETSPTATFNHRDRPTRAGTIGTPIWGVDVRIADAESQDHVVLVPDGAVGEVVIRGHNLFLGYHRNPTASEAAIVDGWFRTGDLGRRDSDGCITIVDRTKDMILRNGYNVYPREIEEVLARHPGVRAVAVFGVPDDRHGQEVVAAVVPNDGFDAEEFSTWVQARIALHKYPRRIEILDELPLGPSGKVLKRVLLERFGR